LLYDIERRYVYTTPKSFLELLKLFKGMLAKKKNALTNAREKYELGVVKLTETSAKVAELEAILKVSSVEVEKIKKLADA
jgi:dynein heavy chain